MRDEIGAVVKSCGCQLGGLGFKPGIWSRLNFGRPSFATPSVDRDVKLLAFPFETLPRGLKRTQTLIKKSNDPGVWSCGPRSCVECIAALDAFSSIS